MSLSSHKADRVTIKKSRIKDAPFSWVGRARGSEMGTECKLVTPFGCWFVVEPESWFFGCIERVQLSYVCKVQRLTCG
jgi:hypothetical protein